MRGAGAHADAVRIRPGLKSEFVLIGKKWGRPIVCNDEVATAKEVEINDPEERA